MCDSEPTDVARRAAVHLMEGVSPTLFIYDGTGK